MTAPLSEQQFAEIRARAEAATAGPWKRAEFGHAGEQEPSSTVVHTGTFDWSDLNSPEGTSAVAWMAAWDSQSDDNAAFIAHARTDVPALLAEVERLRAERDAFADRVDTLTAVAKSNKRAYAGMYAELEAQAATARADGLLDAAEIVDNTDTCTCGGCDTCVPRALAATIRQRAYHVAGGGA